MFPNLSRSTACLVGLGALVTVAVWAGWGAAQPDSPSEPTALVTSSVKSTEVLQQPALGADRASVDDVPRVVADAVGTASGQSAHAQPPTPAVRDGFEVRNGVLTAVRASGNNTIPPAAVAAIAVDLPPGTRPEDVSVAPTGIVTLLRSSPAVLQMATGEAVPTAAGDAAAMSPLRPVTVTRAP